MLGIQDHNCSRWEYQPGTEGPPGRGGPLEEVNDRREDLHSSYMGAALMCMFGSLSQTPWDGANDEQGLDR